MPANLVTWASVKLFSVRPMMLLAPSAMGGFTCALAAMPSNLFFNVLVKFFSVSPPLIPSLSPTSRPFNLVRNTSVKFLSVNPPSPTAGFTCAPS